MFQKASKALQKYSAVDSQQNVKTLRGLSIPKDILTYRMFESLRSCSSKNITCRSQLGYISQSLELRCVHNFD